MLCIRTDPQKGVYFKGIARHPFTAMQHLPEPLRSPHGSQDSQRRTAEHCQHQNHPILPPCLQPFYMSPFPLGHRGENERCRCHRQHCCGRLQPHSKASCKEKKAKSFTRGPWPAILLTQPPVTQALIHPTSEAASTSLMQNWANTRILPYLQDLITLPLYQACVYVRHDCYRINF